MVFHNKKLTVLHLPQLLVLVLLVELLALLVELLALLAELLVLLE